METWTERHQQSFDKIKQIMSNSPVLSLFDYNKKHRVMVELDTSSHTLGAALLQESAEGHWQPVAYASRKLNEAEQRYTQIEKEALAIK